MQWTTFPTNLYFLYFLKVETWHTKQAAWLSLAVTFSSFCKVSPPPQITTHQEQNDYISLRPLLEVTQLLLCTTAFFLAQFKVVTFLLEMFYML